MAWLIGGRGGGGGGVGWEENFFELCDDVRVGRRSGGAAWDEFCLGCREQHDEEDDDVSYILGA